MQPLGHSSQRDLNPRFLVEDYTRRFDPEPRDTPLERGVKEFAGWLTMGSAFLVIFVLYCWVNKQRFWRVYYAVTR